MRPVAYSPYKSMDEPCVSKLDVTLGLHIKIGLALGVEHSILCVNNSLYEAPMQINKCTICVACSYQIVSTKDD